jgi:hypothetical protein
MFQIPLIGHLDKVSNKPFYEIHHSSKVIESSYPIMVIKCEAYHGLVNILPKASILNNYNLDL